MHAALAGALAGLLHVVSGPDHLVAVAPLAMRRPWSGLRIGLGWGLGHASGVVLVGAVGVLLKTVFDVSLLSQWAEFSVGFVLIGIGIWAILQMRSIVVHVHPHGHARGADSGESHGHALASATAVAHGRTQDGAAVGANVDSMQPNALGSSVGQRSHSAASHESHLHSAPPAAHAHLHVHTPKERARAESHHPSDRSSYWVGLIHGAAGTGHLLGVLPSLALPPTLGATYLLCYGIAAVIAMGAFGFTMGLVGNRISATWLRRFMFACGIAAIALGLFWIQASYLELSRP
ncbi:MAG: hypothetical protein QM784_23220 [Polyangiaceae bacterium]